MGPSPFDNPAGFYTSIPVLRGSVNIGSAKLPLDTLYVDNLVVSSGGVFSLPNNDYFTAQNAAGTGSLSLLKADASDNTVLNAKTGKKGSFRINDTEVGSFDATAITYPKFNLTDGSDKNYSLAIYAAGTAYALTAVSAALDFGTTDPVLTVNKAGTYLLRARVNLKYNGATFAAGRTVTLKLRRTNNTAADLTNGSTTLVTAIVTTVTATYAIVELPAILYTTTNTNDALTVYGDVSVVPTAGSLDAIEASIIAVRLY